MDLELKVWAVERSFADPKTDRINGKVFSRGESNGYHFDVIMEATAGEISGYAKALSDGVTPTVPLQVDRVLTMQRISHADQVPHAR